MSTISTLSRPLHIRLTDIIHIEVANCTPKAIFTPVLRQTRMVTPLYKWTVKGARNRTGTSKKRTNEEIIILRNLNRFSFPNYSCKRIAKPYPDGPVDHCDSFRVQL